MSTVPSVIFIVPYRNREVQKSFFLRNMKYILEDVTDTCEIYFAHQNDNRNFNRGAMKNIGFLAMKQKYPDHYKTITFVFNDVDTSPVEKNIIKYKTIKGTIKHFYGFKHALGGIVSITGNDFEMINGFPNLWGWGFEDNELNKRALQHGLNIDRSTFFPLLNENIIQIQGSLLRDVNKEEIEKYKRKQIDGMGHIHNVEFKIEKNMVHVNKFSTGFNQNEKRNYNHDLRDGNINSNQRGSMGMKFFHKSR
uniref:Galactosyltransferase C-terminal domain-containing protein n=1 Tax=viral metagenome TaxID=1070528 RepID=A0A6C0CM65_9ZZZZ